MTTPAKSVNETFERQMSAAYFVMGKYKNVFAKTWFWQERNHEYHCAQNR
jgi:hypothetical protein